MSYTSWCSGLIDQLHKCGEEGLDFDVAMEAELAKPTAVDVNQFNLVQGQAEAAASASGDFMCLDVAIPGRWDHAQLTGLVLRFQAANQRAMSIEDAQNLVKASWGMVLSLQKKEDGVILDYNRQVNACIYQVTHKYH